MGIRFYCPKGHKLNVKSFLAGKRGICPDCGAKVLIPDQSVGSTGAENSQRNEPPDSEAAAQEHPHEIPVSALPLASTGLAPGADETAADADAEIVIAVEGPNGTGVIDPIDENPSAVWYVRLSTGNQYGPAVGDVFRDWIDEGRVTSDSLVWREGWPEWQTASAVFPQLIRQ